MPGPARARSGPACSSVRSGISWDAGYVANQCFKSHAGSAIELADAGDIERDQPFSCGAWVKLAKNQFGAVVSRMDDQHDYRGWDLWIENDRVGSHIVSKWDQDALKVVYNGTIKPNEWNHLMITYDGSSTAAGLHLYLDGKPLSTETLRDHVLKKAMVPIFGDGQFTLGQRFRDRVTIALEAV